MGFLIGTKCIIAVINEWALLDLGGALTAWGLPAVALVRLFGIGEVLSCRIESQPRPRCKVRVLDGSKPCGFEGEFHQCMMLLHQLRLCFQFVDIVDCLAGWGLIR
jgi:hypothetical protein